MGRDCLLERGTRRGRTERKRRDTDRNKEEDEDEKVYGTEGDENVEKKTIGEE